MVLTRLLRLGSIAAVAAGAVPDARDSSGDDDAALQLLQLHSRKVTRAGPMRDQLDDGDARRAAAASKYKARTGNHPRAFAPPASEAADMDAEGTNRVEYHDFVFTNVVYNNLGGLGPDTDRPSGIRYGGVTELDGARIDMVLTSSDSYNTGVPNKNGIFGNLGVVNVKNDVSVDFNLAFLNADTDEPVTLGKFYLAFLDIDNGQNGMSETLTIGGFDVQTLLPGNELAVSAAEGGRTAFTASTWGVGADNPSDPLMLTDVQAKRTVSLKFPAGLSSVQFSYTVTKTADFKPGGDLETWESRGRHFLLAGMTAVYFCEAQPTEINFELATVRENNLGGHGPEFDKPQGLIFGNIATIGDMVLDLAVTNLTAYDPANTRNNGLNGKFAQVNMGSEKTTRFQFTFLKGGTYESVAVDWIYMTLYDLDMGKNNKFREVFDINNFVTHYMTESSELLVEELGGGRYQYSSTTKGTGRDNPRDPAALTQQQKNRATSLLLHKVAGFQATFSAGPPAGSGRNFLFSGKSSVIYC